LNHFYGGEKTKKKGFLLLLSVIALSAVMIISAASYFTMNIGMTANVQEGGTVTVTIDSTTYQSGATLDINWGDIVAGQSYNREITINNQVNTAVTPSISTTGTLPGGSSITLSDTSEIPAFGSRNCNLVLNVGPNPVMGSYTWSAVLSVSTS